MLRRPDPMQPPVFTCEACAGILRCHTTIQAVGKCPQCSGRHEHIEVFDVPNSHDAACQKDLYCECGYEWWIECPTYQEKVSITPHSGYLTGGPSDSNYKFNEKHGRPNVYQVEVGDENERTHC